MSFQQADGATIAFAAIALPVLLVRIGVGIWRRRSLDLSFCFVVLSIVAFSAGVAISWYCLHLGSVYQAIRDPAIAQEHSLSDLQTGSKLLLALRATITCGLWLQVCLLLMFYSHLLQKLHWFRLMINITWCAIPITFCEVILITFLECRPFHLYWQYQPNPGKCVRAMGQFLSQCICNIVLDLMLLIIAFPLVIYRGNNWKHQARIGVLFILGTCCIIVTIMRIVTVYQQDARPSVRILWGDIQIIMSTFVANAPTIYGDCTSIQRMKKEKLRRRISRPEAWVRTVPDEEEEASTAPPPDHKFLSQSG